LPFRFGVAGRLLLVLPEPAPSSVDALRPVEPLDPALRLLLKCQHQPLLRRLQLLPRRQLPLLLRLLHPLYRRLQLLPNFRELLHR
jgi:hypothetical protein